MKILSKRAARREAARAAARAAIKEPPPAAYETVETDAVTIPHAQVAAPDPRQGIKPRDYSPPTLLAPLVAAADPTVWGWNEAPDSAWMLP